MSNVEALYVVHFGDVQSPNQYRNGGVAVLETGRIFGGDSGYYYTGTYEIKAHQIHAGATVTKYNLAIGDVFGDNALKFEIDIIGNKNGDNYEGKMTRRDKPQFVLPIRLIRVAELP